MANSQLVLALMVVLCASYAIGHSYVTKPTSRTNQKQTTTGCRGPACLGPCDTTAAKAKTKATTISRGASINVQWPRNNHAGGFIRFSWTQTSGSDVHANFDNGVQEIHCHEIGGCKPDNANDPNGGDSGPADGSVNPCQTTISVPLYLTDGTWTLQWAWFGGAFALGDYYSCVDYVISGGAVGSKQAPIFYGGDYSYPGQNKCKFFNTNRLHQCVNEPCNNPLYTLNKEQSGPAYLVNSTSPPVTTAAKTPATTAAKTTAAKTTGAKVLTTSRVKSATSSSASATSTTSASNVPVTSTSSSVPVTSGSTSSGSPSGDDNIELNCAGLTTVITSTEFKITDVDIWSNVFRIEVQMHAKENVNNWVVEVIWPADATSTEVQEVFNAGTLQCTASYPTRHSMIAPAAGWAQKIKAGEQMTIEIRAENTNMNADFIKKNTQFKMFRK